MLPQWTFTYLDGWVVIDLNPQHGGHGFKSLQSSLIPQKNYADGWIYPVGVSMSVGLLMFWFWSVFTFIRRQQKVRPHTWGGLQWGVRFRALRYQGCYRTELLTILTGEWLETSSPNTGVKGSEKVCWRLDLSSVLCGMGLQIFDYIHENTN